MTIDLTLNGLKVPDIEGYVPPFGTKITRTSINKGGLSTREVSEDVLMPFSLMRPKTVEEDSVTTAVEYDAKLVFSAPQGTTPAEGYTLTMGQGSYVGCTVTFTNLMALVCKVMQPDGTTALFQVPTGKTMSAVWNGTAWLWTTAGSVTAGDPTPVSSAAVQSAIADVKDRVAEVYTGTTIPVTRDTHWELSGSKPGYFPISIEFFHGWSGATVAAPESISYSSGSFSMQGFASAIFSESSLFSPQAIVVWVKI